MNNQLEVIRKLIESNDLPRINLAALMLENVEDKKGFKVMVTNDNWDLVTSNDYLFDYVDYSELNGHYIGYILIGSPIAEKIWDSNKLDLTKLNGNHISYILIKSPIAEKIWDSGKLDLTKLDGYNITNILVDSPIYKKIWDSNKLDLSKLNSWDCSYILDSSPIMKL